MQLLERASQLHALSSALSEVSAGQGCIALVYGEAGIGKTTLVEQFAKEKESKWRILLGACDLLFTPRPLGPLGDIALQTEGRLLELLESEVNRSAIFPACLVELKRQPTILIIEDIHWADEATLDLLKYLGRRIRQTSCLAILTYRDDEIGADSPLRLLLGDLAASHAVHRIPVPALSLDAVHELVKDRSLDPAALHRLTNGNPFFLTEVLAGGVGIPQTVRDALLGRAARLSAPARDTLEAAAVIGLRVEPWLLAEIADAYSAGIEECISRGMLQRQGDGYAFRHDLARQAILESISVTRKRDLNRRALAALKESPQTRADLTRLASHAEGTKDADAVLEYAPAAARQAAAAGAHRQAAALYELALRLAEALPAEQHAQMLEACAVEQRYLGRPDVSIPVLREIIQRYHALGDRLREGMHLALLALELQDAGQLSQSQESIEAAVVMLEALPPSDELARAYRAQCLLLGNQLDLRGSMAAGEKAIALAEHFEDAETIARACDYAGCALLYMADERGAALMQRSLAVGYEYGLAYAVGGTLNNWCDALVGTFQFEEAASLLQEGIAYTTQHDDDHHLGGMLTCQALMAFYQGHWTEASDLIRQALQRSAIQETTSRVDLRFMLARLAVRRGDADAQQALDEALRFSPEALFPHGAGIAPTTRAEAASLSGDYPQVMEDSREAYELAVRQHAPWIAGELAFWRWRAGDIFTPPDWIARPYALQISGDWRGAAREWEQRGCPYEQAMALMDGDEAAQLAALEIFERLGARPIIEKLKRKMRAEGMHSIPRGPRPATRANRFGLTAREMELLSCLVKGESNNTIARELSLSPRTVEHHISSMLQKTGLQSRNELVVFASKERLLPPS
jgi:predicted ATPase/DNA-binding CsgD family transcriptional regulator